MNDTLGLLLITAPTWVVHGLAVAFVCKSAAPLLRQNERPGFRPPFGAWAATSGILYGPFVILGALAKGPLSALGVFLGLALLSTLPFLAAALSLNYLIPPRTVTARIVVAAMLGLLGIVAVLWLSWSFLSVTGVEMYP